MREALIKQRLTQSPSTNTSSGGKNGDSPLADSTMEIKADAENSEAQNQLEKEDEVEGITPPTSQHDGYTRIRLREGDLVHVTLGKLRSSKVILKEKDFTKSAVQNTRTGRTNQILTCLQCKKTFSKRCNLRDHLLIHAGARPYSCSICKRQFSQSGNRDRHQEHRSCNWRKNLAK